MPFLRLLLLALLVSPLLTVLVGALLADAGSMPHVAHYLLPAYLSNTLLLLLAVISSSIALALPPAVLMQFYDFPCKRFLQILLLLPLALPAYLAAYIYGDALQAAGPVQSWWRDYSSVSANASYFPNIRSLPGAALVLALVLYPYIYLLCRAGLQQLDQRQLEAARQLCANRWRRWRQVVWPYLRLPLLAGSTLVALESLAEFGAMQYLAVDTLSLGVYRVWFGMGDKGTALQLASLLLCVAALLLLVEKFVARRFHHAGRQIHYPPLPRRLGLGYGWLAAAICFFPPLFGFVAPMGYLLSISSTDSIDWARFLPSALHSWGLAALAALLLALLALLLQSGLRRAHHPLWRILLRLPLLGYGLPGIVVAVGILALAGWVDHALGYFFLGGTVLLLVFGYAVRYLAVAQQSLENGYQAIGLHLDDAARNLGQGDRGIFWRIHCPLLRRYIALAMVFVFIDISKELPLSLILRPFNLDTLASEIWRYASDERLASAAAPSLLLVLGSLAAVLLAYWLEWRGKKKGGFSRPFQPI